MTVTDRELLSAGQPESAAAVARHNRWRRRRPWVWRIGLATALVAAIVAAAVELAPWRAGAPATGLRLLTQQGDELSWIDVDTGTRTPLELEDGEWLDPLVIDDGVVVRYATDDPVFADRVVTYREGEPPHDVGDADTVVPLSGSSLWLVVDGVPPNDGGVALTTAFGEWRSRVFSVPPRMNVVGAVEDGLVVARGEYRYRRVQLWDVQLQEPIRNYGLVVGIRGVMDERAMVTTGCLSSGCGSAVIDLPTGKTTDVVMPTGFTESSAPRLTPDGVVTVVIDSSGESSLAIGAPDDLRVVTVEGMQPARGVQPLPAPGDWLVVPTADGDAAVWREDVDVEHVPRVELREDESVIGVSE